MIAGTLHWDWFIGFASASLFLGSPEGDGCLQVSRSGTFFIRCRKHKGVGCILGVWTAFLLSFTQDRNSRESAAGLRRPYSIHLKLAFTIYQSALLYLSLCKTHTSEVGVLHCFGARHSSTVCYPISPMDLLNIYALIECYRACLFKNSRDSRRTYVVYVCTSYLCVHTHTRTCTCTSNAVRHGTCLVAGLAHLTCSVYQTDNSIHVRGFDSVDSNGSRNACSFNTSSL